jgi:nitroreductase
MDTLQAILTRRSIRKYTEEPISDEQVLTVLRAAMYAPSASNRQPWHFIVIRSRALLDGMGGFHPSAEILQGAPLAILVCGEAGEGRHPWYWLEDCANATENLLLAAHAIGLGAVWLGVAPNQERMDGINKMFPLPKGIQPFALIPIGHPAETMEEPDRFKPERIHVDGWDRQF